MIDLIPYKCYVSDTGNTFVYLGKVEHEVHRMMYISNKYGIYNLGDIRDFFESWEIVSTLERVEDNVDAIMLAKLLLL